MKCAVLLMPLLVSVTACGSNDVESRAYDGENQIVFGVSQRSDGTVSAGWSLLSLGHRGWVATNASDASAENNCWIEALDRRISEPYVTHGEAVFAGGSLPPDGLRIIAGQADPTATGGWKSGDHLGFYSTGFAAPSAGPVDLPAPSPDLVVLTPQAAIAASQVAIAASQDFVATWKADGIRDNVVVSLLTPSNLELRCFFSRAAGTGTIPKALLGQLNAAAGTLRVSTQRQETLQGGAWTVYIVATSTVREQPFAIIP